MLNLDLVVAIFSELNALIQREPQLAAFGPAANNLVLQARAIAAGATEIPQIEAGGDVPTGPDLPTIANEALAKALRVDLIGYRFKAMTRTRTSQRLTENSSGTRLLACSLLSKSSTRNSSPERRELHCSVKHLRQHGRHGRGASAEDNAQDSRETTANASRR